MIIKPSIRSNVFTNAHPLGCKENVFRQIAEAKQLPKIKGPKNVLIIGGSSGYGLASRIALAYSSNANTINVSFESAPKGSRTGTAGWWNNIFFQHAAKETHHSHKDFIGDAFSNEVKEDVIAYIKDTLGTIDLFIYSLASGARKDETNGELIRSAIKPIGDVVKGTTIDVSAREIIELTIQSASEQEVKDTIFVMGGGDWQTWVNRLFEASCVNQGFKTISYTYIGGPTTDQIYRDGTIGKAKEDLERRAKEMNTLLSNSVNGEALISSSKAVVTKASVFIPKMPIYVSCLYDVMMRRKTHETILEHKHRLFHDMVYGPKRIFDELHRLRPDALEMEPSIQKETLALMASLDQDTLFALPGTKTFIKEFYQIHGFGYDHIDYNMAIDMATLSALKPH